MIRLKGRNLDLRILGLMFGLIVIGLICQFSAISGTGPFGSDGSGRILATSFGKQILWFFIGLSALGVIILSPQGIFHRTAYFTYGLSCVLLVAVLILPSGGVNRWFRIGFIGFQPSELAKIATVLALARFLAEDRSGSLSMKRVLGSILLTGLPFFLILREPDIGTGAVLLFTGWTMLVWAGLGVKRIIIMVLPIMALSAGFTPWTFFAFLLILVGTLIWMKRRWWLILFSTMICSGFAFLGPLLWSKLQTYQQQRILTFLGSTSDPHGAAYQVIQSKVAIGSGGLFGKGYLQGSQTHLRFLPEQHTDFIFSVLGEEFGFFGISIVLILFMMLFLRLLHTAETARNRFESLIVIGAISVLLFQVIINVGMTVGLVPVTGLPVPFLSYGGSSLVVSMVLIGMAVVVHSRK